MSHLQYRMVHPVFIETGLLILRLQMTGPGFQCGLRVNLASAISKIPFSPDSKFLYIQVRKSYFIPKEQIEWLKICKRPGRMSGKQRVSQFFCICSDSSFKAKYNYRSVEKLITIFDRV